MKTFFKWFFILVLVISFAGGGYWVYDNYIAKREVRGPFGVVPSDAIFIIETSNLTAGWKAISTSNMWKTLVQNQYFKDINQYAHTLDKFLKNNKLVDAVLSNRPMLISAHMVSAIDYDFLMVVDLQSAKTLSGSIPEILKLVKGFHIKKREYNQTQIIEFIDKNNPNSIIYFAILDNLLLVTFNGSLIEKTIDGKEIRFWEKNPQQRKMTGELSSKKLFKFYFNYQRLPAFASIYSEGIEDYTRSLASALTYSAFDINLEDNKLGFRGYSALDSLPSYFSALCDVQPGQILAHNIVTDKTAMYLSISFKNYNIFYQSLIDQYASGNAKDMEDFEGNVRMVEKLLGIKVQKHFFDWIGNEIALIKLRPKDMSRMEDLVVTIHAKNIDEAKEGLGHITKQIRRRSPVKFEVENYKNHEINILERKGIFKLFFGKLFEKLEKPYFTYIEDFVVFSNSLDALKEMVDDYLKGNILSRQDEFMDFMAEFDSKSNVSVFIQMPKMYPNLHAFSNSDTKKSLTENKDLILSFNRIGFQLVSQSNMFATRLISDHNEDASVIDQLEVFEESATDELFKEEFDSLRFKIVLPDSVLANSKAYRGYYANERQSVMFEGRITNNKMNGIWRSYYENGNLKSSVNYKDGKVDGIAYFYYNDNKESTMAEVIYEQDIMTGIYQEFFQNGAQKVKLNHKNGQMHGDAEFYYPTGRIKVKGEYKNNEKRGKWLIYNENGELVDKEKMKRRKK
jgi:antitoxin component YwqK of YwqJK toxin-antitoxin module